jgi:hypothetical protein
LSKDGVTGLNLQHHLSLLLVMFLVMEGEPASGFPSGRPFWSDIEVELKDQVGELKE